jgi:transposase-like protein
MNPGRRAAAGEYVRRVNRAVRLVQRRKAPGAVIRELARVYAISARQAQRYVQAAQRVRAPLPVPEPKVVFTVKVPASVPPRVRARARAEGCSLSALVSRALTTYLGRRPRDTRGGTPVR